MYPRPPDFRKEPPDLPEFAGSTTDTIIGFVLLGIAGFAVWRFGFWWGLAVFAVAFTANVFVMAVNVANAEPSEGKQRARAPVLARVHAVASSFLSGVIAFGVAAVVGVGRSDGFLGIVAAAATAVVLDTTVGWLLDADWTGALGSWCLVALVWAVLSVPLAAWVAPGYEVHGIAANVALVGFVYAAVWIVWFASPWRNRWRHDST